MSNTSNIIRAGIDSYLVYDEENTYKEELTSFTKTFGTLTSFDNNWNNNLNKIRGSTGGVLPSTNEETTSRDAQEILPGTADGSMSLSIEPREFRWLKYVMGSESGSGTSTDAYNYPQSSATTDADKIKYLDIPSIGLSLNNLYGGTGDSADSKVLVRGAKINTATISGSSGEEITASVDVVYSEAEPETGVNTGVALPSTSFYNFDDSEIEIPGGTSIANTIQDFEISIENGVSLRHGLRNRTAQDAVLGERNFSLTITVDHESNEFMKDAIQAQNDYQPTVFSEVRIILDNGTNTLTAHCINCKLGDSNISHSYPDIVTEPLNLEPELIWFEETIN